MLAAAWLASSVEHAGHSDLRRVYLRLSQLYPKNFATTSIGKRATIYRTKPYNFSLDDFELLSYSALIIFPFMITQICLCNL